MMHQIIDLKRYNFSIILTAISTTREKILLLVAIIFILYGVFWWFIYLPLEEEHNILNQKISLLKEKNVEESHYLPKSITEENFFILETLLPSELNIDQLLYQIHMLFIDNDVCFQAFKVSSPQNQGDIFKITISARITSSYQSFIDTLFSLENFERIINVTGFYMRKVEYLEDDEYEINFEMEAYFDEMYISIENSMGFYCVVHNNYSQASCKPIC